ncbi:MAG: hemerythrin domain-containing protein [Jatrophihabitantaceae bacterium]
MCEYCGCQNVPAIAALTAEHDGLRGVAREAADAARCGDRTAAAGAARRLLTLLHPHTEIEERALFPAMAGEFADHVASLQDDHRRIEATLTLLADPAAEAEGWAQDLEAALSELFTHILREQDGLFPSSLSVLTPADWDNLDEVRAQVTGRWPASAP